MRMTSTNSNVYVNCQYPPLLWSVSKQTDGQEKNNFTVNCTDKSAIFEDSVRGVIAVADVKINKMVESGSRGF